MQLRQLIIWLGVLLTTQALRAQDINDLKKLYDSNEVFALRGIVGQSQTPLFYRGAVFASQNDIRSAERVLRNLIKKYPDSDGAYEAHDLLGNLYFRNGKYREAYREIVAALQERPDASDAKSMLSLFTALNALPPAQIVKAHATRIKIDPGELFLPLNADGTDLSFFFDTGANISIMGESTAKALGLAVQAVEGRLGDSSGKGVSGLRLAVVSDLKLGGFHFRNVPFLVISDQGEPWIHLPRTKHGIIGIPLLIAMRSIRWSPAGIFEADFPSHAPYSKTSNMLFHNSSPIVDVVIQTKHLNFTLDTGAATTDLNPAFARALPSLIQSGLPEKQSIEGLGGKVDGDSVLLPSVTLDVAGKKLNLKPAHVFTQHGVGSWAAGNLGMDLLRQAKTFTLDFQTMTLELR